MKKYSKVFSVSAILFVFILFGFKIISSDWQIDVANAKITFTAKGGQHTGTISNLNATFNFDPSHPELAGIKASVDLKNLKADDAHLTEHLMTADFFDAANHPSITFNAESVAKTDSGFVATGKLAIRDSVHTVSIPFTFVQKEKTALVKGSLSIFSGDYGVGKKSDSGKDKVEISIEVPLTQ